MKKTLDVSSQNEIRKRRLLWLSVNASYSHTSLALPLLHAACSEIPGWEWMAVETTIADDPAEVAARLVSLKGDLVCTIFYLFNHDILADILWRFHALAPECPVAAGGPECLGEGAELLLQELPFLLAVFRGEGEGVFPDFLEHFPPEQPGRILPPEGNAVFGSWETTPPPCADPFFRTDRPFVQVETSRGCPMGCAYCTSSHTRVRFRGIDAVAEELRLLREKGVREIRLLDRTFNLPQARGAELLRLFREQFPEMRFHLEIHPEHLGAELRAGLEKAPRGQLHLEAGVQTLSECVQHAIGRNSSRDAVLSGLRFLVACTNFETHADLLAGLPGQTLDELFADTSELIGTGVSEIQLEVLKVLPGTPMRGQAPSAGMVFSPEPPYDVMRTDTMTEQDILTARKLSRLLDLTFNHPALRNSIRALQKENPHFLRGFLAFFLSNGLDLKRLYDLKERFLLLERYLAENNAGADVREVLAYQWLHTGYPPGAGPGCAAQKSAPPPEEAIFLEGNPAVRGERETRYLLLKCRNAFYWFAFNRAHAFNRPAGIWRMTRS